MVAHRNQQHFTRGRERALTIIYESSHVFRKREKLEIRIISRQVPRPEYCQMEVDDMLDNGRCYLRLFT